jgi:hypothetical protein
MATFITGTARIATALTLSMLTTAVPARMALADVDDEAAENFSALCATSEGEMTWTFGINSDGEEVLVAVECESEGQYMVNFGEGTIVCIEPDGCKGPGTLERRGSQSGSSVPFGTSTLDRTKEAKSSPKKTVTPVPTATPQLSPKHLPGRSR